MALTDFDLVLFGGSGDLAMRKLLPAMYARDVAKDLPDSARIICVGRAEASQEEFLHTVETTSKPHIKSPAVTPAAWTKFTARITYVSLNATDSGSYKTLIEALRQDDAITRWKKAFHSLVLVCYTVIRRQVYRPRLLLPQIQTLDYHHRRHCILDGV